MTAPAPDVTTLDALDPWPGSDPELPCEMGRIHRAFGGDQPAVYVIAAHCPDCGWRDMDRTICRRCWDSAAPPHTLRDSMCGARGLNRDECWRIVRVIR